MPDIGVLCLEARLSVICQQQNFKKVNDWSNNNVQSLFCVKLVYSFFLVKIFGTSDSVLNFGRSFWIFFLQLIVVFSYHIFAILFFVLATFSTIVENMHFVRKDVLHYKLFNVVLGSKSEYLSKIFAVRRNFEWPRVFIWYIKNSCTLSYKRMMDKTTIFILENVCKW